jgi:predicted DNA-binding transcriptional regulator AlpA
MTTSVNSDPLPRLMTNQEVLDWLGVPKSTFARWTSKGHAPPRIKVGNLLVAR